MALAKMILFLLKLERKIFIPLVKTKRQFTEVLYNGIASILGTKFSQ